MEVHGRMVETIGMHLTSTSLWVLAKSVEDGSSWLVACSNLMYPANLNLPQASDPSYTLGGCMVIQAERVETPLTFEQPQLLNRSSCESQRPKLHRSSD